MNWDRNWKQLTGNVKRQFGKLIDGQLDLWEGKRDRRSRLPTAGSP
jgi:uncharacterized protein YjbJ (UPF0337 family)